MNLWKPFLNSLLFLIFGILILHFAPSTVEAQYCSGTWTCGNMEDVCLPDYCGWSACASNTGACHLIRECQQYPRSCGGASTPGGCTGQMGCPLGNCYGPVGGCSWVNPPPPGGGYTPPAGYTPPPGGGYTPPPNPTYPPPNPTSTPVPAYCLTAEYLYPQCCGDGLAQNVYAKRWNGTGAICGYANGTCNHSAPNCGSGGATCDLVDTYGQCCGNGLAEEVKKYEWSNGAGVCKFEISSCSHVAPNCGSGVPTPTPTPGGTGPTPTQPPNPGCVSNYCAGPDQCAAQGGSHGGPGPMPGGGYCSGGTYMCCIGPNPTGQPPTVDCSWCTSPASCISSGGQPSGHGYCTAPNDEQCCMSVCNQCTPGGGTSTPSCTGQTPPTMTGYSCGNGTATVTWDAGSNADAYMIRVDRNAPSWDGSCSGGDICNDHLPTTPTQYTITNVGAEVYQVWVHGKELNCSGNSVSVASNILTFSCNGRIQGRRIDALDRGSSTVSVKKFFGGDVGNYAINNHWSTYTTGDILPIGDQYIASVSNPAPGFDVYNSHCPNCISHPSNFFCDDGYTEPFCYELGNSRVISLAVNPIPGDPHFADLYWQFIPRVYVSNLSITPNTTGGAVAAPVAPSEQSGLRTTSGGSNYNNGITITHQVSVETGNHLDLGMTAVGFINSNVDQNAFCTGPDARKYIPLSILEPMMNDAKGFMIAYVHDNESSPIAGGTKGFYLYNGVTQTWIKSSTGTTVPSGQFGNLSDGIVARVTSAQTISSTLYQYTFTVDFYNDSANSRGNRNWKVFGYSENSDYPVSTQRPVVDICN